MPDAPVRYVPTISRAVAPTLTDGLTPEESMVVAITAVARISRVAEKETRGGQQYKEVILQMLELALGQEPYAAPPLKAVGLVL